MENEIENRRGERMKLTDTHPELNIYKVIDEFGDKWDFLDIDEVKNNTISKERLSKIIYSKNFYEDIVKEIEKLLVEK